MGKITSIKALSDQKVQVTLEVTQLEVLRLKGNLEQMHLFSEKNLEDTARLIQRGKKESTKYFLLPKALRKGVGTSNNVECTKIDSKTKYLFIFSVSKY